VKRVFDLFLSALLSILLFPIFLPVVLLVYVKLGQPVFYVEKRSGLGGKSFFLYKIRTMIDKRDFEGRLLTDEERLTPLGRTLRRFSIDEIPQLINVMKGEMSFVGPRPLLMEYLPLYTPEQARRHEVCPGITGWAQVNGRNAITWEDKFKLDIWYVDHRSFWLDLKILWMTIWKVLKLEDISYPGHVTMEKFTGSSLLIVGAGGHGRVVAETANEQGTWKGIAFLDDKKDLCPVLGYPVLDSLDKAAHYLVRYPQLIVAIGNNRLRIKLLNHFQQIGFKIPSIIHPTAFVSKTATVEPGCVILAQTVLNTGAKIGLGCIINTGATIDHNCVLGKGVHLSPGVHLGGGVYVGDYSWIGVGVSVINNVSVGENALIGAGAAVVTDIEANVTAVGVPAKPIRKTLCSS